MSRLSIPWVASVVGLAGGLLVGLVYTWVLDPVQLINTDPSSLKSAYRQDWVRLLALSYVASPDLQRALARLDGLANDEVAEQLEELIEEYYAAGRSAETMRRLTALAEALDVYTPAMVVYLQTPTPTRQPTPSPTSAPTTPSAEAPTPSPTAPTAAVIAGTPTPTPLPPADYQVASQQELCGPAASARIEVVVTDGLGEGVRGIIVWLIWPGGAQRAVTGLKPGQGPGYADFGAEVGETYSLGVGELGLALVDGLKIDPCASQPGEELVSSWRIVLETRGARE